MEGEVRRIHIIYFLSRKGRIEHPHLIRVHHVSQNGVRLCDVKRWLAELRGKDMPESFAWSYKRRYRTGYVWQDLVDEDLITPISDNEYVLKGSKISSNKINHINTTDINVKKRVYMTKESIEHEEVDVDPNLSNLGEIQQHQQNTFYTSPKTTPIFSPSASTQTKSKINLEEDKLQETNKHETTKEPNNEVESDSNSSSLNSSQFSEKNEKKSKKSSSVNSSGWTSPKLKTPFGMVRKIFNCRAMEMKESGIEKLNKKKCDKEFCNIGNNMIQEESNSESICTGDPRKEDYNGGSESVLLNSWKQQRCPSARRDNNGVNPSNSTQSQSKTPKVPTPINDSNCSQCGKMFKPGKMHKHMISCNARRLFGKGSGIFASAAAANPDHDLSSRLMDNSTSHELLSDHY